MNTSASLLRDLDTRAVAEAMNLPAEWVQHDYAFDTAPTAIRHHPAHKKALTWASDERLRLRWPCLLLTGTAGSGKTGLMICALKRLAYEGAGSRHSWYYATHADVQRRIHAHELERPVAPVWFQSWGDLLLRIATQKGDVGDYIEALTHQTTVLGLDDLDTGSHTEFREVVLLKLLSRVQDSRPLIVTMNRPPMQTIDLLGERVVDRLLDTRYVLALDLSLPTSARRA